MHHKNDFIIDYQRADEKTSIHSRPLIRKINRIPGNIGAQPTMEGLMNQEQPKKRCNECLIYLSLSEFHRNKNSIDGRQNKCKECNINFVLNKRKKEKIIKEKKENGASFIIPDIYLVGYGRAQYYQHCCLDCGEGFFCIKDSLDGKDLFCDWCDYDENKIKEDNVSPVHYVGNVVGWIAKVEMDFKKKRPIRNAKKVYERDRYTCQYCGYNLKYASKFLPLHIDHIKPWSAGGGNSESNLVVACEECNVLASDKWFESFEDKKQYILDAKKYRKS